MDERTQLQPVKPLPNFIFMSRWLQLPLYLGLIVAQAIARARKAARPPGASP